jgi:hypothetical protein
MKFLKKIKTNRHFTVELEVERYLLLTDLCRWVILEIQELCSLLLRVLAPARRNYKGKVGDSGFEIRRTKKDCSI